MDPVHALLVFLAAVILDVAWARYTLTVTKHHAWAAVFWSTTIVVMGWIGIDSYILSPWYVIPAALGAAVGTYFTITHAKRKP